MYDIKKNKFAIATTAVSAIAIGGFWWHHDPLRGIKHYAVSDQTIYYRQTQPLFYGPRRERTMFADGISMDQALAQIKSNYSEADGWQYEMQDMPNAFLTTRTVPGERIPESVRVSKEFDGKIEVKEMREISPFETQFIKHIEGTETFLVFPGAPTYRVIGSRGGNLDANRFIIAN